MNKIPVLFVVMQTGNQANGGVESITQIIENLQEISPLVITQLETSVNTRWRKAGAVVYVWELPYRVGSSFKRSPWRVKLKRIKSWFKTNYQVYQLLRQTSIQIVHCNDGWGVWQTAFGAKLAGAKIIYNVRGTKPTDQRYGWHWQVFIRLADHILVLSMEMKEELQKRFSYLQRNTGQISKIYSIVDVCDDGSLDSSERNLLRQTLSNIPSDEIAIGYVAMFSDNKAQLDFIRCLLPSLKNSNKNVKTYFLGDFDPANNKYARLCQEEVERLGLVNEVRFVGYTSDIKKWYHALDLVVVASRYEGLARCMIESIACGTPVASFDVTSAREILETYQCGIVVSQGDYKALSKAILELADAPDMRQQMGENGRQAAAQLFNPQAIIAQYEELYRSLLHR